MNPWLKGGPKRNNGKFGMVLQGRLQMGLNHTPTSKVQCVRLMAVNDRKLRHTFGKRSLVQMFLRRDVA